MINIDSLWQIMISRYVLSSGQSSRIASSKSHPRQSAFWCFNGEIQLRFWNLNTTSDFDIENNQRIGYLYPNSTKRYKQPMVAFFPFDSALVYGRTIPGGGGGFPYETDGDARCLA